MNEFALLTIKTDIQLNFQNDITSLLLQSHHLFAKIHNVLKVINIS